MLHNQGEVEEAVVNILNNELMDQALFQGHYLVVPTLQAATVFSPHGELKKNWRLNCCMGDHLVI